MLLGDSPFTWPPLPPQQQGPAAPGVTGPAAAANSPFQISPGSLTALLSPVRPQPPQELPFAAATAPAAAAAADSVVVDLLGDLNQLGDLLDHPLPSLLDYKEGVHRLDDYSLGRRVLHEKPSTATMADLLMAKPTTMRKHAMVLTYTFPDGAKVSRSSCLLPAAFCQPASLPSRPLAAHLPFDAVCVQKNELLYSFIEQAGKAKGSEVSMLRTAPAADELVCGAKLRVFDRHAKGYVVLLPVSPPPNIDYSDTAAMLDVSRSWCFTDQMSGHLVMLQYKSATSGQLVMFAWGVVADRAYANCLDLDTRVRVLEDNPLGNDVFPVDHNKMLLPVHLLGTVGTTNGVAQTWEQAFDTQCSLHATKYGGGLPVEQLLENFASGGAARWDLGTAATQALLPRELKVCVPSMEAALKMPTASTDWDDCLYAYRAMAIVAAGEGSGADVKAVLDHLLNKPEETLLLPPTKRAAGKPKAARLGHVLTTAAAQARRERFRC